MAPVATSETPKETSNGTTKIPTIEKVFNPFYSPPANDENDGTYEFAHYKVSLVLCLALLNFTYLTMLQPRYPDVKWEPLKELEVVERGLFADPEKKALLAAATKVQHLTPAIGTEIAGIDLRQLSPEQKDELYVPLMSMSSSTAADHGTAPCLWQREESCVSAVLSS